MQIQCLWEGPNALGEGPLWDPNTQSLYWIDIVAKKLHRYQPCDQSYQEWQLPQQIGCIALATQHRLIAAIGDTVAYIELATGEVSPQKIIGDRLRVNDGKCDRFGRFWFGNVDMQHQQAKLYCYTPEGQLLLKQNQLSIANGLGWSPDNTIFYHTDSPRRQIYAYDYDARSGQIQNRRIFVQTASGQGVPDGLTVDSQGYVWSAQWDAGKVFRYTPSGKIDLEINMPVKRPTACTFGGPNLDVLYITSCSLDVGENHPLATPAGALFAIQTDVQGLAEIPFGKLDESIL